MVLCVWYICTKGLHNGRRLVTSPKGGVEMPLTLTFHIGYLTITIQIKANRHPARWRFCAFSKTIHFKGLTACRSPFSVLYSYPLLLSRAAFYVFEASLYKLRYYFCFPEYKKLSSAKSELFFLKGCDNIFFATQSYILNQRVGFYIGKNATSFWHPFGSSNWLCGSKWGSAFFVCSCFAAAHFFVPKYFLKARYSKFAKIAMCVRVPKNK